MRSYLTKYPFVEKSFCPESADPYYWLINSAVNAICNSIRGITWKDVMKGLMKACVPLGTMPRFAHHALLLYFGFQPKTINCTFEDLENYIDLEEDKKYILYVKKCGYVSFKWDYDYRGFAVKGLGKPDYYSISSSSIVQKVYTYDILQMGTLPKAKHFKNIAEKVSPKNVLIQNANDTNNIVGDCAVRALASGGNISWGDAVNELARSNGYTSAIINERENIKKTLERLGFQQAERYKCWRVREICDIVMNERYKFHPARAVIFTYGHCVAIIPKLCGEYYEYYISDTWDSSSRKAFHVYIKTIEDEEDFPILPSYT